MELKFTVSEKSSSLDTSLALQQPLIKKSLDQVTLVAFHRTGHQLLIATNTGSIHLYMKGAALNQWSNTHSSNWNGEEILFIDFFHSKSKPFIQITDIKLNASYSEKFQCKEHEPTLKTLGNCSQNGFFAISSSGLIMACSLNENGHFESEVKAVLGPIRDNFILATASLAASGLIHVAAWKHEMVKCWEVRVGYSDVEESLSKDGSIFSGINLTGNRKLHIKVQSTQSFFPLPNDLNKTKPTPLSVRVTHLKYTDGEDPNSLLVALEVEQPSSGGSSKNEAEKSYFLQRYQLIEKTRFFCKFLQDMSLCKEANETTIVKEWAWKAEWTSSHRILAVSVPQRFLFPGSSIPYAIVASTADGAVYTINRDSMLTMNKYSFQSAQSEETPATKRQSIQKQIISLAPTWTNLHVLALDYNGGLHLLSLLKQADVGTSWAVSVMLLLEYCVVTECDCLDILMVTPPNSLLTLSERLMENFFQHPTSVTSNLLSKFLVLKNAMLRMSSNLHQRSIETKLQAQLSTILKLFWSLRPVTTDGASGDKNLSSVIQGYIESRNSLDFLDLDKSIENLLFSCNIIDCQIDPSLAQNVQSLLQFATDLSLYLLLLLVQNPKYELIKEPKILQYLREVLFLSRIWYRHNKLVFPQMIKKTDSVDIWAQLYKLLTRLAQIIPNETDTAFLDDCVVLETQVVCREIPLFIPARGIVGCLSSVGPSPPYPIQFTFDDTIDPNPNSSAANPRPLEGSLASLQPLDTLYYHFLDSSGSLFQCTRCFAVRGSWWGTGEISIWEQEWANKCICSGHWAPASQQHSSRSG